MNLSEYNINTLIEVTPKKAQILLEDLEIRSYEDMLYYIPYRYIDRTRVYQIREINKKISYIQLKVKIKDVKTIDNGKSQRMTAVAYDHSGTIELVWFKGFKYIASTITPETEYLVFGQVSEFNHRFNIVHPEIDSYEKAIEQAVGLQPIYNTTERMKKAFLNSKAINRIQTSIFRKMTSRLAETLPAWFLKKYQLETLHTSLYNIHFPNSEEELNKARHRLKFEELFYIQLNILRQKFKRKLYFRGNIFEQVGHYFNTFYQNHLPFQLTNAQKRVIKEIRIDCGSGRQMNRLLQGDVGSGKTLVALMSMLISLDNAYQTCLMAPTEILATQHFVSISEMLQNMDIKVELLTGSTTAKKRRIIHEQLSNGEIHILIGTHALLEDTVIFQNIGLAIIDEQHRFGVAQRAKLWSKNNIRPHILIMTATPIPRTLAMTLYGDLDVSVIDELPPGRKPISTYHVFENKRDSVYKFIEQELQKGRQAYIVYPLISASEKLDYKNLENGYEQLNNYFTPLNYKVAMVHGKMKAVDKEIEMQKFVKNESQILVATTVIEVGVNVPNASIMIIESSERFGLSQLHQLRGRVGRGAEQSYCILMSAYKISNDSRKRLETMTATNDGFEIAEVDLKLRGMGDLEGTQQSGLSCHLKIANLGRDTMLLSEVSRIATEILEEDSNLELEKNNIFAKSLTNIFKTKVNWRYIS